MELGNLNSMTGSQKLKLNFLNLFKDFTAKYVISKSKCIFVDIMYNTTDTTKQNSLTVSDSSKN